jgi:hypothetical protein
MCTQAILHHNREELLPLGKLHELVSIQLSEVSIQFLWTSVNRVAQSAPIGVLSQKTIVMNGAKFWIRKTRETSDKVRIDVGVDVDIKGRLEAVLAL